ncbi:MAG: hypothetical protein E6Q43_04675 [Dokdonella sp.]|nr:hypothetical protein BVG81_004850 [Haliangium sp. UPWRP_2]TXI74249.1 MAG: hypothetical protein E6Q43_04675 [Dokdonella sp.]
MQAERDALQNYPRNAASLRFGQDHQVRVCVRGEVVEIEAGDDVAVSEGAGNWQQSRLSHHLRLCVRIGREDDKERIGSEARHGHHSAHADFRSV